MSRPQPDRAPVPGRRESEHASPFADEEEDVGSERDPRRGEAEAIGHAIRLVLLAGPSGSGKSRLVSAAGCPRVNLDDFYRDEDDPANPRTRTTVGAGAAPAVDWDDVRSWDAEGALAALVGLYRTGEAEVPVYDIAASRRTGTRSVALGGAHTVVAEGLFAPDLVPAARAAGLAMDALYLDRPRGQTLVFRFVRDLAEHRKPLPVLLRRGLARYRAEPVLRAHALTCGCRPVGFAEALAVVRGG